MRGGRRGGADQWRGGTARSPAPRCLGARRRAFPPLRPPARWIVVASPPPPSGYLEAVTPERFPRGRGRGRGKLGRGGAGRRALHGAPFCCRGTDPRRPPRSRWSRSARVGCCGRRPAPSNLRERRCPDLPGRLPSTGRRRVTREPWFAPGLRADGTPVSPGNNPGLRTKGVFCKGLLVFPSQSFRNGLGCVIR